MPHKHIEDCAAHEARHEGKVSRVTQVNIFKKSTKRKQTNLTAQWQTKTKLCCVKINKHKQKTNKSKQTDKNNKKNNNKQKANKKHKRQTKNKQ